ALPALSGGAALQLDAAGCGAARPDHDLPGMAHQVGVGEFYPRAFVAVVVERIAGQLRINLLADAVARGVARLQVENNRPPGGDAVRPDDAGGVVRRLDDGADQPGDA